jgi:hypothetical protein
MATVKWTGSAASTTDTWTVVVNTAIVGDDIGVTIGDKTVSVECGTTTEATEAAALQVALAASSFPEFREYTWTVDTATITAAANTPGIPGTLTAYETGTADVTVTNTVAATGPSFVNNAENWSTGAVPVNSDDVIVEKTSVPILYALTALSGVSLTSFKVMADFTGTIGLPERNPAGYYEYRARYLVLGGDPAVTVGEGDGRGSGRINLSVGTGTTTYNVWGTGGRASADSPALCLKNSGNTNVLNVTQGDVGLAVESGATGRIDTIRLGNEGSPSSDVRFTSGAGATLGTINMQGGNVVTASAVSGLTQYAGSYTHTAGALTATVYGGTLYYNSTTALTSVTARGSAAVVDFSRDPRAKTITNGEFTAGAKFNDPYIVAATWTNPLTFDAASMKAADFGPRFTLQRT